MWRGKKYDVPQLHSLVSLRLLVRHVHIPHDRLAFGVTTGCPVSKTLWGQTGQVSFSQSDFFFNHQISSTSMKIHSSSQRRLVSFPHTETLWWFTALVRSPHKHPHVIIQSFKEKLFTEVRCKYSQFARLLIWWNIQMMMGFFHLFNNTRT